MKRLSLLIALFTLSLCSGAQAAPYVHVNEAYFYSAAFVQNQIYPSLFTGQNFGVGYGSYGSDPNTSCERLADYKVQCRVYWIQGRPFDPTRYSNATCVQWVITRSSSTPPWSVYSGDLIYCAYGPPYVLKTLPPR